MNVEKILKLARETFFYGIVVPFVLLIDLLFLAIFPQLSGCDEPPMLQISCRCGVIAPVYSFWLHHDKAKCPYYIVRKITKPYEIPYESLKLRRIESVICLRDRITDELIYITRDGYHSIRDSIPPPFEAIDLLYAIQKLNGRIENNTIKLPPKKQ